MKNNCNKIKQTCGATNYATCIEFEGTTNTQSELSEDCSLSLEETTQDIYNQLEAIDLSELGEKCLEYVKTTEGKIIVKNVLLKFEEEICDLKEQVEILQNTAICETSITGCDFDFNGLVDDCNNGQPENFKQLIQLILDNLQP